MYEFIEKLEQEWAVIEQAPFIFTATFILALGLAYGFFRHLHSAKLSNKDSQLKLANDRLEDFKKNLKWIRRKKRSKNFMNSKKE
jgi:Na+/H+ antiporter NhaC